MVINSHEDDEGVLVKIVFNLLAQFLLKHFHIRVNFRAELKVLSSLPSSECQEVWEVNDLVLVYSEGVSQESSLVLVKGCRH